MLEIEWLVTARADLLAIIEYIADDDPGAAQRLKDDVEAKTASLREFPKMCRIGRVAGTREMVVCANYIVVYMEDAATVRILRVLHAAQQWPLTDID